MGLLSWVVRKSKAGAGHWDSEHMNSPLLARRKPALSCIWPSCLPASFAGIRIFSGELGCELFIHFHLTVSHCQTGWLSRKSHCLWSKLARREWAGLMCNLLLVSQVHCRPQMSCRMHHWMEYDSWCFFPSVCLSNGTVKVIGTWMFKLHESDKFRDFHEKQFPFNQSNEENFLSIVSAKSVTSLKCKTV